MLILIHVTIALASIASTTVLAFWPTMRKLYASYALIALTLISGTFLVVSLHTPMLKACETGLAYLAVALTGVAIAHYRLAHMATETQSDRSE